MQLPAKSIQLGHPLLLLATNIYSIDLISLHSACYLAHIQRDPFPLEGSIWQNLDNQEKEQSRSESVSLSPKMEDKDAKTVQ